MTPPTMLIDRIALRSRSLSRPGLAVLFMLLGLVGCQPSDSNAPASSKSIANTQGKENRSSVDGANRIDFVEVGNALPDCVFRDGKESGIFALPETTGGGTALVDWDNDGVVDAICSGGGLMDPEQKKVRGWRLGLFRGLGGMQFLNCTVNSQVDTSSMYNAGLHANDFDNDGFVDLLVTGYQSLQLYRNQGDGTFEFQSSLNESLWSIGAAFFDADQDGDLDVYVAHYANWSFENNPACPAQRDPKVRDYCGPRDYQGLADKFYCNQGDGTFVDQTDQRFPAVAMRGLGVLAADLDGDRRVDLYVANDVEPNLLYRNEPSDPWTEMGRRSGVATNDAGKPEGSMGIAIGDYNLDGKFDLWVTNYENEIGALYRNLGKMSFAYSSNSARIAITDQQNVGWGTCFNDVDLDGDEDLIVVNGHLELGSRNYLQRSQVLQNIEGKYFVLSKPSPTFFETPQSGRGLAIADLDRDGRMDLCVTRLGLPHAIARNTTAPRGKFLHVQLVGVQSNRDAIGAVGKLTIGDRTWVRQIYGGGSYASTSERAMHFGIPESLTKEKGSLTIEWPTGRDQIIPIERWDSFLKVIEE